MSIELHIERLVIDEGVLRGERAADVRALLERDLARQLAQPGAVAALRSVGAVSALTPAVLPEPARGQDRLGSRLATTLRQSLGVASAARNEGGSRHG
ncbi:hypothetical protein [Dyella sp. 2RAB6]|uniref:hypothetical protein n=1 Tax=Dyella sp. 2RAB6 TaxID=3232992 RepID=UPI003F8EC2AF